MLYELLVDNHLLEYKYENNGKCLFTWREL